MKNTNDQFFSISWELDKGLYGKIIDLAIDNF